MDKKLKKQNFAKENKLLTKYILQGYSNEQMAESLNYSRSTICFKLNKLFKEFSAKNRFEFIINLLSNVIMIKKEELINKQKKIAYLEKENKSTKRMLKKILETQNDKETQNELLKEAQYYII